MDRLKKARKPVRSSITRTINEVECEIATLAPDKNLLNVKLEKIQELVHELEELDRKILDAMLDANCDDDVYEAESESIEDYKDKARDIIAKLKRTIGTSRPGSPTPSDFGSAVSGSSHKRTFKFPKIEVKKFNGDLKDWLSFWSQFEKIHEDDTLHESDKFQYLVQSMTEGTRASKLVNSYPQTAANYAKVISALQDRFGDKVLLAEFYVRELLKFVNTNLVKNSSLSSMYDELESHLRALETLGVSADQSAIFLYPMVESSLPIDIIKVWQRSTMSGYGEGGERPAEERLQQLMKFLRQEVKGEERLAYVSEGVLQHSTFEVSQQKRKTPKPRQLTSNENIPTVAGLFVGDKSRCIFCDKNHDSKECWKAPSMTLEAKNVVIRQKRCCFLCLRPNHQSKSCKTGAKCLFCGKKHCSIMCPDLPYHKTKVSKEKDSNSHHEVVNLTTNLSCSTETVLKILQVTVVGAKGSRKVRAILDDGSQRSYIAKNVAAEIGLPLLGVEQIRHTLFGGVQIDTHTYKKYQLNLSNTKGELGSIEALDKDEICGELPKIKKGPWMQKLREKKIFINDLASGELRIELLIGAKDLANILTGRMEKIEEGLVAIETTLGWTLMGQSPTGCTSENSSVAMTVTCMQVTDSSVEQLWNLEPIGIKDPAECKSKKEKEETAKKHFLKTVSRSDSGRYTVCLPWIDGKQEIPNNRVIAERRLATTTNKLISCDMYKKYDDVFNNWLQEGIIEEVPNDKVGNSGHYLPHRAVFKPESTTTPIRPVFDASCKSGRNPSLNDCVEKGPNLLDVIPSILLRFREGKIGAISDIRKAFLMISINKEDRDYLRFLWWEEPKKKYRVFRHKRVVFGVNCSPFLLGAVIELHLKSVTEDRKLVAEKLLQSLYVDNCVTSVDTYEEYEKFKTEATEIMREAQMDLRLWQCSSVEAPGIGSLTSRECGLGVGGDDVQSGSLTSVLGLKWNTEMDTLSCDLNLKDEEITEKVTKRKILSMAQKIFDPIGYLCPALLCPKLILQETWAVKTGWDEELSDEIKNRFGEWCKELHHLNDIQIPRNVTGNVSERDTWQLHTFVDASKDAYAAAVFLRTGSDENTTSIQLLSAKSRIAPMKKMTIPRLELMACTIGARLCSTVKKALSIQNISTAYWSDSSTALAWIRRNDEWGTFVGNRVKEILQLTEESEWRHVPGIQNPADIPSRGCSPSRLLKSRWWEGPQWLKSPKTEWPVENAVCNEEEVLAEKRKTAVTCMITTAKKTQLYLRYSSYYKNIRHVAFLRRYIDVQERKLPINTGFLSVNEIEAAEKCIVKLVQAEEFPAKVKIPGIIFQKDEEGILRVETKLLHREDTVGFRHPILLPNKHPFVDQIIQEEHLLNGHAGIQLLMGKLREKYWILQTRRAVRRVVLKCTTCRRHSAKKIETVASALPKDRVSSGKVFETVGVDLAGPLNIKKKKKAWIVLFTCAVYRCVHLELVKSLSTEAFLEAFNRFVTRRGRPVTVYSDNGANFVGAVNLFKELDWNKITSECGLKRIQWKFNPPAGPWWGGFFERLIRTVKEILRRVLGKSSLSYDKLRNMLCDTEAFINSRPLTTVTEEVDDLRPLTPAMFLYELPCATITDQDLLDASGFQKLLPVRKKILDELKMRFRREYLSLLVQKGKSTGGCQFKIGDVVLVGADNKKRWEWPLAKIVNLIPGRDGTVRVAHVKTANGILTRPLPRLFSLEVSSPTEFTMKRIEVRGKKKSCAKPTTKVKLPPAPIQLPESAPTITTTRSGRATKAPDRFKC